jgi:photosystem II stability/assembly factor-like uncharacterized protein
MTRTIFAAGLSLGLAALGAGCTSSGPSSRSWEDTGGPYAQNVSTVLAGGRTSGTLYVSTGSGDIAVSTSEGKSWSRAASIPGGAEVRQIVQDPDSAERLLAATESGAFVSGDGGKSWTPLSVGPSGTGVRVIAIDPWATAVVYAGTEGKGMFKSTDGGKTWDEINASADLVLTGSDVFDIGVDLSKPDFLFAAVSSYGIIASTNGGADWKGLTPEGSGPGSRPTRLLLRSDGHGTLIFGTTSGSIMKSTNGGNSWSPSRTGKSFDGILSLCALPGNPDGVIAGTEHGILVSSDFGSSWTPEGGDLPAIPTHVTASGTVSRVMLFAFGSEIGLRASEDGGRTWRKSDLRIAGTTVSAIAGDPAGERIFAATGSLCMSYTPGNPGTWSDPGIGISGGPIRSLSADPAVPGLLYATTAAGLFNSTDYGAAWSQAPRSIQVAPFLYQAHPTIHTRVFMANDQGIFVSTDRGRTWGQARPLGNRWVVHSLTFCPSNAGTIIAASSNTGVVISRDGGFTWEQSRYGIPGDRVDLIALDDADPDTYYAYLPDGECFRSLNKGLEWNRYSPPWKEKENVRVACDPLVPSSVVALVGDRQIYYSPSGGGTWFRLFEAALPGSAASLSWNSATKTLYAAARDKGVYRIPLGERIRELLGE